MRSVRLALAGALLVPLAACGDSESDATDGAGSEPTTPGAIAALVVEHLADEAGEPTYGRAVEGEDRAGVGVSVRYGTEEDPEDGDLLAVGVGKMPEEPTCEEAEEDAYLDGCESYEGGLLLWQDEEPEEDPGVYTFVLQKGDVWASVYYAGDSIIDDPRTSDLSVPVDAAVALLKDPAFDATTSQEWIDRGEEIEWLEPAEE